MKREVEIRIFLDSIDKLILERKYIKAEKYLQQYIDQHSDDHYPVILKLVCVLTINGKFEKAIELSQPLLDVNDVTVKERAAYELAYIYGFLGDYNKSLEYINICLNPSLKSKKFIQEVANLKEKISILLKLENHEEYDGKLYKFNSEKDALKHIIDRHSFANCGDDNLVFNESINIESLFYKIKEEINNNMQLKYIQGLGVRYYYFSYTSIGYDHNGRLVDILKVITTSNGDIITMFPATMEVYNDYINSFNVNSENFSIEQGLQKIKTRKSQIDKFNQRYGKMG